MKLFPKLSLIPADVHGELDLNVLTETLGREHSGKTGARSMIQKTAQDGPLPSGLELSAKDPRVMVRFMNESIQTYSGLQQSGFISTIEPTQIEYHLYLADKLKGVLQFRESIGQLLTFTDDHSDRSLQEQFQKHHSALAKASVVHIHISCPADNSPESLARLQNDQVLLMPNLRAILNSRAVDQPLAVALVLTKLDGAFASAEEAQAALTETNLRGMLNRMVRVLEGSDRVGLAAIIPTSAFGFGKSRLLEMAPRTHQSGPGAGLSLLSENEPEWILKEGTYPDPYNITELTWWTFYAGLALKKAHNRGDELARTVKLLQDDLTAINANIVTLNCSANRR